MQYLSNNPERFIESNTENSWNECINIMSMQGTWCNALFVQAVADLASQIGLMPEKQCQTFYLSLIGYQISIDNVIR